ncbi:MAG: hypothetical protein QOJ80_1962 [Mycobacterium sp.]|nr:hypothetical protein [Mycobacterium sp.]
MTTLHIGTCRATARTVAAVAVAGISVLSMTLPAPIAHADDIPIRSAVDDARSRSKCLALNYRDDLAGAAYAYARGGQTPSNGYPGRVLGLKGTGDPASAATQDAIWGPDGTTAIQDCKFRDFGVSLLRDQVHERDTVAIVLGQPTPGTGGFGSGSGIADAVSGVIGGVPSRKVDSPQLESTCGPACQVPVQVAASPTATVTSDVDVYDKPGGNGNVTGVLRQGELVKVVKPCPSDDWCALADGRFAWGQFFTNN